MSAFYREHFDDIKHAGLTFRVELAHDNGHGAPWDEEDGHGPVRAGSRSTYSGYVEKRPGERVLHDARHDVLLYDWQEAIKIAKRDGWGIRDEDRATLARRLWRAPTAGEVTEEAVRRDFNRLRAYCNDQWHYVGVIVTLLDTEGDPTHLSESLWGIESDCEGAIREHAAELAEELADEVGQDDTLTFTWPARVTTYTVRSNA